MKYLILISFILSASVTFSQTQVSRSVIGNEGNSITTSSGINYQYNIGEVAVTTLSSTSFTLKQGFEQPEYTIGSVVVTFNPPNVFTPDGDGVNDTWILPINFDVYQENTVTIYNRWGDEIKRFSNYNNLDESWDGTDKNGTNVIGGTFFYIIEFPDSGESYSGWVQVLR